VWRKYNYELDQRIIVKEESGEIDFQLVCLQEEDGLNKM